MYAGARDIRVLLWMNVDRVLCMDEAVDHVVLVLVLWMDGLLTRNWQNATRSDVIIVCGSLKSKSTKGREDTKSQHTVTSSQPLSPAQGQGRDADCGAKYQ